MISFTECEHDFADSSRCVKCGWQPGLTVVEDLQVGLVLQQMRPPAAAVAQKVSDPYGFAERIEKLEREIEQMRRVFGMRLDIHVERLERLERPVDSRDAIAWEIGHAAALRGDGAASNPFRRVPQ